MAMTTANHEQDQANKAVAEARRLLDAGHGQQCIDLLVPLAVEAPGRVELHLLLADAAYGLGRHDIVLSSTRSCLRHWSLQQDLDPWDVFRVVASARNSVPKHLHWSEWAGYWQGCTDDASLALQAIADGLLADPSRAGELSLRFDEALKDLVPQDAIRRDWVEAFRLLADGLAGRPRTTRSGSQPPLKKIIVSGKGWSGSGAVFDFLREFDGVIPIWGESQYIDGHRGIKSLVRVFDNPEAFRVAAVNFFFGCLLGRQRFDTPELMKSFIEARTRMASGRAAEYAANVLAVSELLTVAINSPSGQRDAAVASLCEAVLDRLAVTKPVPEGGFALLDNVVHIDDVEMMRFIGHTHIFCTFRDPRSNYVALVRESPGFGKSAADYAAEQRKVFPELREKVARVQAGLLPAHGSVVHSVQFEDFVLSESSRRRMASDLGLAWPAARRFQEFRPWESARNVLLHEEFERPEDIELLARELADHCVSVKVSLGVD